MPARFISDCLLTSFLPAHLIERTQKRASPNKVALAAQFRHARNQERLAAASLAATKGHHRRQRERIAHLQARARTSIAAAYLLGRKPAVWALDAIGLEASKWSQIRSAGGLASYYKLSRKRRIRKRTAPRTAPDTVVLANQLRERARRGEAYEREALASGNYGWMFSKDNPDSQSSPENGWKQEMFVLANREPEVYANHIRIDKWKDSEGKPHQRRVRCFTQIGTAAELSDRKLKTMLRSAKIAKANWRGVEIGRINLGQALAMIEGGIDVQIPALTPYIKLVRAHGYEKTAQASDIERQRHLLVMKD